MSDKDIDELLNKKVKVLFGLEQQGHIPLIEEELKTWWPKIMDKNPFQIWRDISERIGWIDYAVCDGYIRYLRSKNKNSTPNAKIEELIVKLYIEINTAPLSNDEATAIYGVILDLKKLIKPEGE